MRNTGIARAGMQSEHNNRPNRKTSRAAAGMSEPIDNVTRAFEKHPRSFARIS